MTRFLPLLFLPFLALPDLDAQSSIRWSHDFDEAFGRAKKEKKVVFVAINMAGERANDEAIAKHYRDAKIGSLSQRTVNLFATADRGRGRARVSGPSLAEANRIEMRVRDELLGIGPDRDVVAPQHLFVDPEGKVLLSVPYRISIGELEWMFVTAIRKLDPAFRYKDNDRMRAPRRLREGYEAPKREGNPPPTKEEIEELLRELKRGRGSFRKHFQRLPDLVRSPDPQAIKFARAQMRSRWVNRSRRVRILGEIGRSSPDSWVTVVQDWVDDKDDETRRAAIWSLGKLGSPKAARDLERQLKAEKDPGLEALCLRSLILCKPTSNTAIRTIDRWLGGKDEEKRVQATVATASLEKRRSLEKFLLRSLGDASAKVRSTAAWVIGTRREKGLEQALVMRLEQEQDAETKGRMQAAKNLLDGKPDRSLDKFLEQVVGDREPPGFGHGKDRGRRDRDGEDPDRKDRDGRGPDQKERDHDHDHGDRGGDRDRKRRRDGRD